MIDLSLSIKLIIDVAILLGIVLIAGNLFKLLKIPKVTGFLLTGILISPYVLGKAMPGFYDYFVSDDILKLLDIVKKLGIGLIIFIIGGQFERDALRRIGKKIFLISACEMGAAAILVGLSTVWLVETPSNALILAIISMSTAPAATLIVVREYEAKGPLSRQILILIGVSAITTIILFKIVLYLIAPGAEGIALQPLFLVFGEIAASIVIGGIIGFFVTLIERFIKADSEFLMLYIGAIFLIIGASNLINEHYGFGFSELIAIFTMGIIVTNVSVKEIKAFDVLKSVDLPIYAVFFILAGMKLEIAKFSSTDLLAVIFVYAGARALGKLLGAYLGSRISKSNDKVKKYLGIGLITQEGIAIGLVTILSSSEKYKSISDEVSPIIVAAVIIFALIGPLFAKQSIIKAGEVKLITYSGKGKSTGVFQYLNPYLLLRRTFGLEHKKIKAKHPEHLICKDVMRQAVEKVHDTMPFDDLIDFASQCKYDTFPVVDDHDKLLGTISYSSIRNVILEPAFAHIIIAGDIMEVDPPYAFPDDRLTDMLDIFTQSQEKLDYLPVVDSKENMKLVGIVIQSDVLLAMRNSQKNIKNQTE